MPPAASPFAASPQPALPAASPFSHTPAPISPLAAPSLVTPAPAHVAAVPLSAPTVLVGAKAKGGLPTGYVVYLVACALLTVVGVAVLVVLRMKGA